MRKHVRIVFVGLLFSFGMQGARAQLKYGPIVNQEKGKQFLNDIILNKDYPFDPKKVKRVLFLSPTPEHPYHAIVIPVKDFKGGKPSLTKLTINGEHPDIYFTFVGGELRFENWLSRKATVVEDIVLLAKTTWHNRTKYDIRVEMRAPKVLNPTSDDDYVVVTTRHEATSPGRGGAPDGWKYGFTILLSEESGLDRTSEPVNINLLVHQDRVKDLAREVRVMEYQSDDQKFTEIPSQTYNHQRYEGRGSPPSQWGIPTASCDVFFLADVKANASKIYGIFYGNLDAEIPDYATDLRVDGEGLGSVVENSYWEIKHHDRSGQLHYYRMKARGRTDIPLLSNTSSGSVHWNPDTYAENGRWGHTFSWDPPENIHILTKGPLLYKFTRSGRMPGYNPEMFVSVTYTYMAHCPYVLMSSVMEIINPYGAQAIRNGEMVFDADVFDHYAWKAKNGERRYLRTLLNPDVGNAEASAEIPVDVPWLCLYNSEGKFAMGALPLHVTNYNRKTGQVALYRPKYFLYSHPQWTRALTYFVRTLVYPFGHAGHATRGPVVQIPEGNVYVEEMAFMPFLLGSEDPFEPIEVLNEKLRHPLEIQYGN